MQYLDSVVGQVIAWVVAGILAWLALRIGSIKVWLEKRPWAFAVLAAVIISGIISSVVVGIYSARNAKQISALEAKIVTMQETLSAKNAALMIWGGTDDSAPTLKCPPGMYVVGIQSKSVPGGGNGYLESSSVICRPLNVN
ncbi:hypothetical protein [Phyllobacterium chamaecytisi]|uniref:hypothetical protein n=1 Tax=Phyllobacterium chamaecytisi TaxID=2876082 RepID=UPI001CCD3599|nr:hypothetical protein [Phyllobacterium sp. KW56]MBZ9604002.1 hypothetical protein [Phyllobacterium sp. KW56]